MAKMISVSVTSVVHKSDRFKILLKDSNGTAHVLEIDNNPAKLDETEIREAIMEKVRELNGINKFDCLVGEEFKV
jgi:hypothetical protein